MQLGENAAAVTAAVRRCGDQWQCQDAPLGDALGDASLEELEPPKPIARPPERTPETVPTSVG